MVERLKKPMSQKKICSPPARLAILIYVEKLIFLSFHYASIMVSPLRGSEVGEMSYRVARRWCAASPPVTYGVALRAFWDTTTYTSIGYIVVTEKLNFLPKRV
jgi:hypothetical protein